MFLLKNLGNLVFGSSNSESMVEIPSGQLYKVDPNSQTGGKELIFRDAAATIRRTTAAHQYQLVITRVYEEGDENLGTEEDDDLLDDERTFLLDQALRFRRLGNRGGPYSFQWADPSDKTGSRGWEFAIDLNVREPQMSLFEDTVYTCIFERSAGRSHGEVSDEELTAFVEKVKALAAAKPIGIKSDSKHPQTPLRSSAYPVTAAGKLSTPVNSSASESPQSSPDPRTPTPANGGSKRAGAPSRTNPQQYSIPIADVPPGVLLKAVNAQLYLFDIRVGQFVLMRDLVTAELSETDEWRFQLVVKDKNQAIVCQPIEDRMAPTFNAGLRSFVWVFYDDKSNLPVYTWSLKFIGVPEEEAQFRQLVAECMFETKNKELFRKMKKDEQDYVMKVYDDDPMDIDAQESDEEEEEQWEEEEEEQWDEEIAEDDDALTYRESTKGSKNSQLAVGYKHDRSFVVRGDKIGVFKHTDDDQLKFATTINNIRTLEGVTFSPRKVMLHEQDSSMVMMKPGDEHNLYKMDLEYGKVVEEWKVDDYRAVDEIVPDNKYAQLTPAKTLIGIGHNSIFRIDPRLAGNKLVEGESKQYQVKNDFTCATTTGKGELAVGSSKGEIRLYNKLNIKAKTHLPGLGDPIIGIDTTENGKWIIATCRSHLLLINTEIKNAGGQLGYQKSMGSEKPQPKRLQLKPEHVAWLGCEVNFTPARFSTGDSEEQAIITSTGPHVIRWNFRRVKAGHLSDYTIKTYSDKVVADNFKYGQDRAMIVTLPENVEMITKNKLSTPVKLLKSRSSIVNSPY